MEHEDYFKGRGAQINTSNKYLRNEYVLEHMEGIDEPLLNNSKTQYIPEFPKKIVNKVTSPDIGMQYSMNPYQGCEHGCLYCYARNTHEYWGLSAGLDFERKIIVKENAPELLANQLDHPKWNPAPIMLSGNTDCYQPVERKKQITRRMLEVLLKYKHPVGIITKNSLILRDIDLLKALAEHDLVHVSISITTLDEKLRQTLEPRTAASHKRLKVVKELSDAGIPINVMLAPIIPSINSYEVPEIVKQAAAHGASSIGYTIVRLNGAIGAIFEDWLRKNFPDRANKVLNQVRSCHGGRLNDSRFGVRTRGEGNIAESIRNLFHVAKRKHFSGREMRPLNLKAFCGKGGRQLNLFQEL